MIDRTITPVLKEITYSGFPEYEIKTLDSGARVYFLTNPFDQATKVEMLLPAGASHQDKKLLASFYGELLLGGTKEWSAQYISESLDHLGGFYGAETDKDHLSFQMYGLAEQMPKLLSIATESISNADFPLKEVEKLINIKRQKMVINNEKVSYRARKLFGKHLFGNTPYGQVAELSDFDLLSRDDFMAHHQFVRTLQPTFFVVGKWTSEIEQAISNLAIIFGQLNVDQKTTYQQASKETIHDEKEGAIQTAIRLGRLFPSPNHEDYYSLHVMTTLLGGYFGSRLMMNLREDKGLTYGIGSVIVPFQNAQYFGIATEVNADQSKLAMSEILKEIKKLQTEPVDPEELLMVKNYMKGKFLRSLDGHFALIEKLMEKWKLGYPEDHEEKLLAAIRDTDAEKIMTLAQKYLKEEDLLKVTAGKLS